MSLAEISQMWCHILSLHPCQEVQTLYSIKDEVFWYDLFKVVFSRFLFSKIIHYLRKKYLKQCEYPTPHKLFIFFPDDYIFCGLIVFYFPQWDYNILPSYLFGC